MSNITESFLHCLAFEPCTGIVKAIRKDGAFVDEIVSGDDACLILDKTCFYAEQGGQIYDTGVLTKDVSVNQSCLDLTYF